jgi:hypothetical protein
MSINYLLAFMRVCLWAPERRDQHAPPLTILSLLQFGRIPSKFVNKPIMLLARK